MHATADRIPAQDALPPEFPSLLSDLAERDRLMAEYLSASNVHAAAAQAEQAAEAAMDAAWEVMNAAERQVQRLAADAGLIPANPDPCSCEHSSAIVGRHVLGFRHRSGGEVEMTITLARSPAGKGGGA